MTKVQVNQNARVNQPELLDQTTVDLVLNSLCWMHLRHILGQIQC